MRIASLILAISLSVLLALVGCGDQKTSQPTEPPAKPEKNVTPRTKEAPPEETPGPEKETPSLEDVKKEAGEAAEATGKYLGKQRDEAIQALGERWSDLRARLDTLEAQARKKGEEALAEFRKRKPELKKKLEQAKAKLEEAKDTAGKSWDDLKDGLGSAFQELEKAYQQASERVTTPEAEEEK